MEARDSPVYVDIDGVSQGQCENGHIVMQKIGELKTLAEKHTLNFHITPQPRRSAQMFTFGSGLIIFCITFLQSGISYSTLSR